MFQDRNAPWRMPSQNYALNLSTNDLQHLADIQTKDEELKTLISSNDLSIKLKPLKVGNAIEISLFCDVSREEVRPYMPERTSL
ncbi:hypothetical protein TNIN_135311 [Trichonephila inaurata madagascariensis]|uniref:Uncharacterized protein n=1 Tax=Trichonephila inaurata madagascariensis TaxID=2747483 RepID=A0A8X6YWE6_9ARAC|nr:hypothetical protein TNIN_135311 [Trichonephila inaurata madagascariensis]